MADSAVFVVAAVWLVLQSKFEHHVEATPTLTD